MLVALLCDNYIRRAKVADSREQAIEVGADWVKIAFNIPDTTIARKQLERYGCHGHVVPCNTHVEYWKVEIHELEK